MPIQSPDKLIQMPTFKNALTRLRKLFQFEKEDENSWFTITPTLEHRKRPAVFEPQDVTPVSRKIFGGARDAGIYTRGQLSEFWDKNLIGAASRKTLQKYSRELIVPNTAINGPEQYSYYSLGTDFYVDKIISPNYFKNQFLYSLGSIAYVLEFL